MPQERIWILAARKLSNEATVTEQLELQNLLKNNDEISYAINIFYGTWNNGSTKFQALQPVEKIMARIKKCDENI